MPPRSLPIALVVALLLGSCSSPSSEKKPVSTIETASVTIPGLFLGAGPEGRLCEGVAQANLDVEIVLEFWLIEPLPPQGLIRHTQALERHFAHYGLRFRAHPEVHVLPKTALIRGTDLAPLMRLLNRVGSSPGRIQVILATRILSEGSVLSAQLQDLAGLTLRPLDANSALEPADLELQGLLGPAYSEIKAPIILLAEQEISTMPPHRRHDILAHELGHALGLPHVAGRERLMSSTRHTHCRAGLVKQELGQLQAAIDRLSAAPVATRTLR